MSSILEELYTIVFAPEKFHIMTTEETYIDGDKLSIKFKRGAVLFVPIFKEEMYRRMSLPKITVTGLDGFQVLGSSYRPAAATETFTLNPGKYEIDLFNFRDEFSTITETWHAEMTPFVKAT